MKLSKISQKEQSICKKAYVRKHFFNHSLSTNHQEMNLKEYDHPHCKVISWKLT